VHFTVRKDNRTGVCIYQLVSRYFCLLRIILLGWKRLF